MDGIYDHFQRFEAVVCSDKDGKVITAIIYGHSIFLSMMMYTDIGLFCLLSSKKHHLSFDLIIFEIS